MAATRSRYTTPVATWDGRPASSCSRPEGWISWHPPTTARRARSRAAWSCCSTRSSPTPPIAAKPSNAGSKTAPGNAAAARIRTADERPHLPGPAPARRWALSFGRGHGARVRPLARDAIRSAETRARPGRRALQRARQGLSTRRADRVHRPCRSDAGPRRRGAADSPGSGGRDRFDQHAPGGARGCRRAIGNLSRGRMAERGTRAAWPLVGVVARRKPHLFAAVAIRARRRAPGWTVARGGRGGRARSRRLRRRARAGEVAERRRRRLPQGGGNPGRDPRGDAGAREPGHRGGGGITAFPRAWATA